MLSISSRDYSIYYYLKQKHRVLLLLSLHKR